MAIVSFNKTVLHNLFSKPKTRKVEKEYPEGTRADRILADLKRFFDTGELPEISDTPLEPVEEDVQALNAALKELSLQTTPGEADHPVREKIECRRL